MKDRLIKAAVYIHFEFSIPNFSLDGYKLSLELFFFFLEKIELNFVDADLESLL